MIVSSNKRAFRFIKTSNLVQYLAAITANLGIICSEMHYGWTSPSLPVLLSGNYTFTITSEQGSWLVVAPLLGSIPGALITGMFGPKKLIVFWSIPFIVCSWFLVASATSNTYMFIARFIVGLTDGILFTAVPMYLGEIADRKIRGFIASICPVCIIFGFLLINILGSYLSIPTTAYVASTIPILLLLSFVWMPESPYFYIKKDKTEDAKKSLQIFLGKTDVSSELARISEAVGEQNRNKGSWAELLTVRSNRNALLIVLGLRGVQQLTGTTVIIFYCQKIFEESADVLSPSLATIIYFSVQLVLTVVASVVVDYSGRRPLLIISTAGTAIALFLNGSYLYIKECTSIDTSNFNFIPLVALLAFVIVFSIGLQTIPLLIMGELFPTNIKGIALCSVDIYYNVVVTASSKFFLWSSDGFGMYVPFYAFSMFCVLGLIFIVFLVPETKGKTLEDIQKELKGKK